MNAPSSTRIPRLVRVMLVAVWLFGPALANEAIAQSDAATVTATVNVLTSAVAVTAGSDLDFGTHFAAEGLVAAEVPATWNVDTGGTPLSVDLTMTLLPPVLNDGVGVTIPLTYGADSFAAFCGGVLVQADPAVGIPDCLIDVAPGLANVVLGNQFATAPDELVRVDLTGAAQGTYFETLELTATLN